MAIYILKAFPRDSPMVESLTAFMSLSKCFCLKKIFPTHLIGITLFFLFLNCWHYYRYPNFRVPFAHLHLPPTPAFTNLCFATEGPIMSPLAPLTDLPNSSLVGREGWLCSPGNVADGHVCILRAWGWQNHVVNRVYWWEENLRLKK